MLLPVLFCILSGLQRRGNCLSFIATAFISFHFSLPSTKEHTQETNKEGSRKTKRQITIEREINEQRRTEVREQRRSMPRPGRPGVYGKEAEAPVRQRWDQVASIRQGMPMGRTAGLRPLPRPFLSLPGTGLCEG